MAEAAGRGVGACRARCAEIGDLFRSDTHVAGVYVSGLVLLTKFGNYGEVF